ncbi:tRNA preQ1(34) S-adenosylmethionine ribosyltransferase-isomerase QueA [Candidatus Gracilibacteria bacterium CG17_big_fil_post_rev_8_21_14_2_50_48_13]|nr:MAG: tRNA preQ1(34) S-adenosylmethionine ribosyltransferase-isomerase QueA [Candidatus Gracilibacteria bacterium CG17_big_fil_post_rev_8_21_14_2_50_48_13]
MDNNLTPKHLLRSSYSFLLPEESIARTPTTPRDASRLMVLHCGAKKLEHKFFYDLPSLLPEGTLMVRNNSQVIPARLRVQGDSGWRGELFFLEQEGPLKGTFFVRPGKKFPLQETVSLRTTHGVYFSVHVHAMKEGGERVLSFDVPEAYDHILNFLEAQGETPFPPYIGKVEDTKELRERYQTVYAEERGSIAAPTAGLHFTKRVFDALAEKHIFPLDITLHVGAGTFLPVKTDDVREHRMHKEYYSLTEEAVRTLDTAWEKHEPLLAVGTTSLRTLEHLWRTKQTAEHTALSGTTDIFIHPPERPESAQMLLTNFHLPESTLLMLVAAFAGDTEFVLDAYNTAVREGYRFYSFGDAMLLLP